MPTDPAAVVAQLKRALAAGDFAAVYALAADDYTESWPQSGELVPTLADAVAIDAAYPGGLPTVVGTPRFTDTADGFVVETTWDYPEAGRHRVVGVCVVRDGRLRSTRLYFAAPFPPADWRSRWVRIVDDEGDAG